VVVVVPGRWGGSSSPAAVVFVQYILPCFALALVGLSPCRGIFSCLSALSPAFSLAQRHRHVVQIVYYL
jgi:hypothetical protein